MTDKEDKSIGTENFQWDLSVMYKGIDDPRIDEDVKDLVEAMGAFNKTHKGSLEITLAVALHKSAAIHMLANKIFAYLHLCQSLGVGNSAVKAKLADVQRVLYQASGEHMAFFDIELVKLDGRVLEKIYKESSFVAKHRPRIEQIRLNKPHMLGESVEAALTKRFTFGPDSWSEFYDELEADLRFQCGAQTLTQTELLHKLMNSKDANKRFELMTLHNEGLKKNFAKYSAQTLHMVVSSQNVEDRDRKRPHPMYSRNRANLTSDNVVATLHEAVMLGGKLFTKKYYQLKARHLGMKKLQWSDRNAPMPFADNAIIPFDEALSLVIAAYQSFSPTLAKIIRKIVANNWIDAPALKGKQGGAFNYSIMLPGHKPASFTFLNYLGSARDVMTLAHELGHGVHGLLAAEAQGVLMMDAPTAFAETASVFGEMTTFNFLKEKLLKEGNKEALLALVMRSIDDTVNTVVRQIGFSNFERRIHGMDKEYKTWNEPRKLSVDELNQIWMETVAELYGNDGDVFEYKNMEYLWSYIPHFHRPFYVYGYAFGQLLTTSLYAQQDAFGDKFEPLYLDLLRAGSSKNVVELLEPFNLDPTNISFWVNGINKGLVRMVQEAEKLTDEIMKK